MTSGVFKLIFGAEGEYNHIIKTKDIIKSIENIIVSERDLNEINSIGFITNKLIMSEN